MFLDILTVLKEWLSYNFSPLDFDRFSNTWGVEGVAGSRSTEFSRYKKKSIELRIRDKLSRSKAFYDRQLPIITLTEKKQ